MPTKILVVNREPAIQRLFKISLEKAGYTVIFANNCVEGLITAAKELPDLVIVDHGLPGAMDGLEFCRRLHGFKRMMYVPIIYLSPYPSEETHVDLCLSAIIQKPFSFDDMLAKVQQILQEIKAKNSTPISNF